VVSPENLLLTLNDLLLESPALVQEYSYSDEPEMVDIPFPVRLDENYQSSK
jgi:hypothetical protein